MAAPTIADEKLSVRCSGLLNWPINSKRAKITDVTVAANPHRGPFRQFNAAAALQPFVEAHGAPAHIGMRGAGHFEIPSSSQNPFAVAGLYHSSNILGFYLRFGLLTSGTSSPSAVAKSI